MIIDSFIAPLLLTIFIEGLVAFALGCRDRRSLLVILLVNAITNPILNYMMLLLSYFGLLRAYLVIIMEVMVVAVEWRLMGWALKRDSKRLLSLSIAMNTAAYIFGIMFYS